MRWVVFAAAAAVAWASASSPARADELTAGEAAHLRAGDTVTRPESIQRGDRRYVGGVTYTIVHAPEREVAALLDRVDGWRRFLPRTRRVRVVGTAGGDSLVEVTHGSALVQVTYTMRLHRDGDGVRFWMDPSRPHDIDDMWGFFRTQPLGHDRTRTLMTYGILVDMGSGLLRDLFEDRVREAALSVPDRVRGVLAAEESARSAGGTRVSERSFTAGGARARY